jgi:hypothetical protein
MGGVQRTASVVLPPAGLGMTPAISFVDRHGPATAGQLVELLADASSVRNVAGVEVVRLKIRVFADQREPVFTGHNAVSAVFETISGNADFLRVRAPAYVDLNRNIGGRLGSDLEAARRRSSRRRFAAQPRRTGRSFADNNVSETLSVINKKLVLGFHLRDGKTEYADGGNNSKLSHGDVSGHLFIVPTFNSTSKSMNETHLSSQQDKCPYSRQMRR